MAPLLSLKCTRGRDAEATGVPLQGLRRERSELLLFQIARWLQSSSSARAAGKWPAGTHPARRSGGSRDMLVDLIIGTTLIALAFDSYLQRQRLHRAERAGSPCPGCGRSLGYHVEPG